MLSVKQKNGVCKVALDGDLTIYEAEQFHAELDKYMTKCQSMEVNLEKVTEIDTSGVQIKVWISVQHKPPF